MVYGALKGLFTAVMISAKPPVGVTVAPLTFDPLDREH